MIHVCRDLSHMEQERPEGAMKLLTRVWRGSTDAFPHSLTHTASLFSHAMRSPLASSPLFAELRTLHFRPPFLHIVTVTATALDVIDSQLLTQPQRIL